MSEQTKNKAGKPPKNMSRRDFITNTATAAALSFTIVPSTVLGGKDKTAPSDKINVGIIGVGGQGINDMKRLLEFDQVQVVSVSDPVEKWDYSNWWYGGFAGREPAREIADAWYAEKNGVGKFRACTAYADFREMLDKEAVDAVLVATTDHVHAVASMAALQKGKHVYCEKPLTWSVYESRRLAQVAREKKVATQMGNSGQASEETRLVAEFIADGAIGEVRAVHNWTDRPIWPQGLGRPKESVAAPRELDWNLWVGPAPMRPYHPDYIAVRWRGWADFGTGALGDMGCHSFFPIFKALNLGHPVSVEGSYSMIVLDGVVKPTLDETWPVASIVKFEFPARGSMPPVTITWYDGGIKPMRPEEFEQGREWRPEGVMYIGDKGKMLDGRLIPEARMQEYKMPPKSLPRSPGHYEEWIQAIKGGEPAGANFDYASLVTEVVLLGNIALRTGKKLLWDGANMRITNDLEANMYLHRQYRSGWTI